MIQLRREEIQHVGAAAARGAPCKTCFHRLGCLIMGTGLSPYLRQRTLRRGQRVPGIGPAGVMILLCGALKARIWTPQGRECVLGFYLSGDAVVLHDALPGLSPELVALETSQLCEVNLRQVPPWQARQHELAERLREVLVDELARVGGQHMTFSAFSVRERLARFLLTLAAGQRQRGLRDDVVLLPMSREDIGNHLGARLETISREFTALQRDDLIALQRREIRLLDARALRALAGYSERSD